ncbi:MAG: Na+/H+ antiporter NhaC family protein [Tissierellia bacterium]|nr:Na+/H+ antiporter NhaC family protein [Tissierellia bacterium]
MNDKKDTLLEFHGGQRMALIPMLIFVFFCILFFVVFKVFDMEALATGGFIGLIIGSFFSKDWKKYWDSVTEGVASPMNAVLIMILFVVGIFTQLMAKSGVAGGFVWLGDLIQLKGGVFTAFTFIATCIIATATGTSIGTMFSAFPILFPSGILLGANPALLSGAILSGAIFGDNLAPVSDTTIASAATQLYRNREGSADIGGVVASRFKFAITGAIISTILYAILGGGGDLGQGAGEILQQYMNPKGLIMLIPVAILLYIAIKTRDIFTAITWGIISGTIIALIFNIITVNDIMHIEDGALGGFIFEGVLGMIGIAVFNISLFGIIGVLNASGTMDSIINGIVNSRLAQTEIGSEIAIALGVMVSAMALGAASGPAIIMFGPIANEIGQSKDLHPYRRANLIDGYANTIPTVIPFISAFIFIALTLIQGLQGEYAFIPDVNPIQITISSFYPIALFLVLSFSVFTGWGREYEGTDGEPVKSVSQ